MSIVNRICSMSAVELPIIMNKKKITKWKLDAEQSKMENIK
jgi:hypothetical protein